MVPTSESLTMPISVLKMYGAFRSGSNYTKALLDLNHNVEVKNSDGGYKHAPHPAIFDGRD